MQAGSVVRIERNVERGASLLFALSCSYAAFTIVMLQPGHVLAAVIAAMSSAVLGYALSSHALGLVPGEKQELRVPEFAVEDFDRADVHQRLISRLQNNRDPVPPLLLNHRYAANPSNEKDSSDEIRLQQPADRNHEPKELLLVDRYQGEEQTDEEPLLLDTIVDRPEGGPEVEAKGEPEVEATVDCSRVVQLFDPQARTPGQLKSKIDRHLERSVAQTRDYDASQALHEALAELRRSLR